MQDRFAMNERQTQSDGRLGLYPEILPYRTGRLKVSALHELHYEECGNPNGKAAVLLHGGPGGGSTTVMRRYHDPARYRIILFDQRGCGRSTPHASIEENTTWHLVDDIEQLREHLKIERWQVFGGSWGSTLALAYAETHPERATELVLRGIFTLRRAEIEWFYQEGCSWIFPEAFEDYLRPIPVAERGDLIAAYYRRLTHPDPQVQLEAARAWSAWEGKTLSLLPDAERVRRFSEEHYALAFARIECHYFIHGGFFDADEVKDVLAVLWYLADPVSNLRAAALLRSRFIRLSDEGLRRLSPHFAEALRAEAPPPVELDDDDAGVPRLARESTARS